MSRKIGLTLILLISCSIVSGQDSIPTWVSGFKNQQYSQVVLPGRFEIIAEKSCHYRNIQQLSYDDEKKFLITGGATAVKGFSMSDTGFKEEFSFRPYKAHNDLVKYSPDKKRFVVGSYGGFSIYSAGITQSRFEYKFDAPDNWAGDAFFDSAGNMVVVDWHGYGYFYDSKNNKVIKIFDYNGQHRDYMRSNAPVEEALSALYHKKIGLPHSIISRGALYGFRLSEDLSSVVFPVNENGYAYIVVWDTQKDTIHTFFQAPCDYVSAFDIGHIKGEPAIVFASDSTLFCFGSKNGYTRKYRLRLNGQLISSVAFAQNGMLFIGTEDREALSSPRLIYLRPEF